MKKAVRFLSAFLAAIGVIVALTPPVSSKAASFSDVTPGKWSEYAIGWASDNGYMNGVGNGLFRPEEPMTRAMVVTVLSRIAGVYRAWSPVFYDVPDQTYYSGAVIWAYENGVVQGTGNGFFSPAATITREQCATMVYNFARYEGRDTSARADISLYDDGYAVSAYAQEAMSWIVRAGIVRGTSNRTLSPKDPLSREQFAMILMLYLTGGRDYIPPTPVTSGYNPPAVYSTYTAKPASLVTDADFYVSPVGDDAAAGTFDAPFRTFARAQQAARSAPGIIVVAFKAGDYGTLNVFLDAADSNTVYCKYGDGDVIFSGGGADFMIGMYQATRVTLRGFTFKNAPKTVLTLNDASSLTIENCTFEDLPATGQFAAEFYKPENITFRDCTFRNIAGGGIYFQGELEGKYQTLVSSGNKIENCLFENYCTGTTDYEISAVKVYEVAGTELTNNEFRNSQWCAMRFLAVDTYVTKNVIHDISLGRSDYGVIYTGRSLVDRGGIIDNNILYNITSGTGNPNEIYGVYLDDGIAGQTVTNNLFYNAGNCAVLINGGRDNIVRQNVVIDTTSGELGGIMASGKYYDHASYGKLDAMGSWPGLRDSMSRMKDTTAWRARFPAIFAINMDPAAYNDPACVVVPAGTSVTDNTYIGNAGYKVMAQAERFVVNSNNLRYELSLNPFFADPAAGNYTVTTGTPAINVAQIGRY